MRKIFLFFLLIAGFNFVSFGFASADFLNQTFIFNINPDYEYLSRDKVSATLKKISDKGYWYVSDDYWTGIPEPERSLFLSKLDELAIEFDSRIYPTETQFWGSENNPGIDNDPRVAVLLTRLIDLAGGYFDTAHLYKKNQAPGSNEREMFFINSSSVVSGRAKIFLAHEFQHLIGFNQKDLLRNVSEDIWLNEARAEYAPKILGYDDVFDTSNIRRRIFAFSQSPSEPLAEWKSGSSDYGAVALFMYYLVDHYGDKILTDSLKSSKFGIESVNETLRLNGFSETFSDIFSDWTMANILNDASVNPKFAYKSAHLKDFRVSVSQSYAISGSGVLFSIANSVKDWQPVWYEFNVPIGSGMNLRVDFNADFGSKFRIPYIIFKINGQKEIGFLPIGGPPAYAGNTGTLFIKNFGSEIHKVVIIPANHSKTSDFTKNDQASSFTVKAQFVSEVPEFMSTTVPIATQQLTNDQLVQNLLSQIQALQAKLVQLKQESIGSFNITRDLFTGSTGEDVKQLQNFLIKEGVYPEARITGYFGLFTKNAVIRFQQKYAISPQIGYVGLKTRAKIQELLK